MEPSLSSPGDSGVMGPHSRAPVHLPLPPGIELAEVSHVDGGTAPAQCLLPAHGLWEQGHSTVTLSPPWQPGSGSHPLPVPLTLIQGWTRHSDAVMRCLRHRGRRWGWGSRPYTSTMGIGRWGWCWWEQRREPNGSGDDGDGDVNEMKMEIEVGWR